MDLRVALIAGTVFAGVLAGGALVAPRLSSASDGSTSGADQQPTAAVVNAAPAVDIPALAISRQGSDDRDDGDHLGGDHGEDDD
jgi:hypothetical protein